MIVDGLKTVTVLGLSRPELFGHEIYIAAGVGNENDIKTRGSAARDFFRLRSAHVT